MPTSAAVFDDQLARWKQEMEAPWARLKYQLVQANLARHLGPPPLRVLDAGGGNGLDALPLAAQGYPVDLVDYSPAMLADAARQAAQLAPAAPIVTHSADLRDIAALFPAARFDLVLCHNVLQYIDDVPALFRSLAALLRPGGWMSVVSINRYSIPYHAAFLDGDLAAAFAQLGARTARARIFDADMRSFSAAELSQELTRAGLVVEADYGIRCLCDYWGDNARKADPQVFAQIERLERALTGQHPYKLLARYFQVIARRPAGHDPAGTLPPAAGEG